MLSNFSSKKTDKEAPSAPSRSAAPRPSANEITPTHNAEVPIVLHHRLSALT